mmetsp:Transcript_133643/g.266651  ORF Transcript_133643/g.266651 Transcript_133643/m.266651 type:complete len:130 (+) Transcript_133643:312-701(+)
MHKLHVPRQALAKDSSEQYDVPSSLHVGHLLPTFHAVTHSSSPHVSLVNVTFGFSFATAAFGLHMPHVRGHSAPNHEDVFPLQYLLQSEHCSQRPLILMNAVMQVLSVQVSAEQVLQVLRQWSLAPLPS